MCSSRGVLPPQPDPHALGLYGVACTLPVEKGLSPGLLACDLVV